MASWRLGVLVGLAGCTNTLQSTEVTQLNGMRYEITVSEYDSGLWRVADVLINGQTVLSIDPKTSSDIAAACTKVRKRGSFTITCVYKSTFEGKQLEVRKVTRSSLLALSINYEVYLSGDLLEVVSIRNQ